MSESIKSGLLRTMISALEAAGIPTPVAERIAGTKKLCCKVREINGIRTRHYCLADECMGDWREEIEE